MSPLLFAALPVLYVVADLLVSLHCFGYYHSDHPFSFSFDNLKQKLFWEDTDGNYSFIKSPTDFLLLSVCRVVFLIVALVLAAKGRGHKYPLLFLGWGICNASYSLVKVLAFSEIVDQLYYPGVWFSLAWNVLGFGLLYSLWKFVVLPGRIFPISNSYHTLVNEQETAANGGANGGAPNGDATASTSTAAPAAAVDKPPEGKSTLQHILFLLKYTAYYWKWVAGGFSFLLLFSVAKIFIPLYTAQVIANIVHGSGSQEFVTSVIYMSGFAFAATLFGGLRGGCFLYSVSLVTRKLMLDLFTAIVSQEIGWFDESQSGEIISRGTVLNKYHKVSEKAQSATAESNRVAEEVVSTMRTVRSFACEKRECGRYEGHLNTLLNINMNKSVAYAGLAWVTEACNNAILICVLFYGGHLVLTGKMTNTDIIAFLLYQIQLGENFYGINAVFGGLMESVGASRKVFSYLTREPRISNKGTFTLPEGHLQGKIEFLNVHFTYPTRPTAIVLNDISFTIQPGERVALVGPSGAGKSSIISLIERFYEPTSGSVTLDSVDIAQYSHSYYHQKVALVAQEPVLYAASIRDNIIYGCESLVTEEDMISAAKLANIHDFIINCENGYQTKCGEKGTQMSGGQKQRIAIARALVRQPVVLILDEATSALDAESEHIIQQALLKCAVGRSVIVIAHRLSTVENADRILVIDKGHLVQSGNHSSLMLEQDGLYRQLVQRQLLNASSDDTDADQNEKEQEKAATPNGQP